MGRLAAELILGETPFVNPELFSPERFGEVDPFSAEFQQRCADARSNKKGRIRQGVYFSSIQYFGKNLPKYCCFYEEIFFCKPRVENRVMFPLFLCFPSAKRMFPPCEPYVLRCGTVCFS